MFRKLLFIVSLLYSALFRLSAEVDYLKVKEITDRSTLEGGITLKKAEGDVAKDENVVYYEDVAINEKSVRRIVIYLPSSCSDRIEEAKKQFKNILNSKLINNGNFNLQIVEVPERWKNNGELLKTRQMPGIAVRIDNAIKNDGGKNIETFPVMCSTKGAGAIGEEKQATKFLTSESWASLFDGESFENKQVYYKQKNKKEVCSNGNTAFLDDGEHTERQLFYSLIYNNIVSDGKGKITLRQTNASSANNSTFFVWTKGNPCITDENFRHDNGGYCCLWWYGNILLPKLRLVSSRMYIYFDNEVNPSEYIYLDNSSGHKTLVEALAGTNINSRRNFYYLRAENIKDKQVLGVRMTGETVPNDFCTLFVNVDKECELETMKKHLLLQNQLIPYVIDNNSGKKLSYSFTTAERHTVLELLNRWMNREYTIQFIDHYEK